MQNAAGDGGAQAPHDRNDAYRAVVSDLISLVEHIQNSLRPIERTIARETSRETSPETSAETLPGSSESSTSVIVLDGVSPRYMKAAAAVQACDVNLGIALCSLLDSGDDDSCASSPPALAVIGAKDRHGAGLLERTMSLRRKFSPGFSRAVNHLLRSLPGVRHATGTASYPDAATTMEKLDAALNNMSHGLCMFGPDNRLQLWNDRYVKMYKPGARPPARRIHARRNARGAQGGRHRLSRPRTIRIEAADRNGVLDF